MGKSELTRRIAVFNSASLLAASLLVLVAVLLTALPAHADDKRRMVFSGVVLEQGSNQVLDRFTRWLSEKSGYALKPAYVENYQALSENLRATTDNFAWTCGWPFVEDHRSDGQQLVAVPLFRGQPAYHALVIARKGRSEKRLADFKGQVAAYSDPRSNSGFLAPTFALHQQGIPIELHFRLMLHTGRHENSIKAVVNGLADVASVDEYIWEEYTKGHPAVTETVVVLERLGPYPFTPVVAGAGVPPEVIEKARRALVSMHEDPRGAAILKQLGLDGFVDRPLSFYKPIIDMLEAIR